MLESVSKNDYFCDYYLRWITVYKEGAIAVINNVRWGTFETYDYCFEGISSESVVAIGTVGGSPRRLLSLLSVFYYYLGIVTLKSVNSYGFRPLSVGIYK